MTTIRTHTTLRTLFAATAVFAVLAAMWTAVPRAGPLKVIVTPCAVCFVIALFGLSLGSGFIIALATTFGVCAFFVGTGHMGRMRVAWVGYGTPDVAAMVKWVIQEGLEYAVHFACWFAAPWATSWWWGSYLRYVWSKPRQLVEPIALEEDRPRVTQPLSLYERMLVRCELTPIGIFIITVLVNVLIVVTLATAVPLIEVRE